MPIAGLEVEELVDNQLLTNNDTPTVNFDNNMVVDGYAGSQIENYVKYIDGLNLEVDYYSFVRGNNGETTLLDVNDTSQQYIEVKQLLLKVTSPIPDATNFTDMSLDAVLDANVTPAENDLAILQLPSGLVGIFKVSINDKRTYITKKIYDIKLTFLYFKKDNLDYYNNLLSKVKKKYIYDKSYITTNSAPIILESTYKNKVNALNLFNTILKQYMGNFIYEKVFSVETNNRIFDINIQQLLISMMDSSLYGSYKVIDASYNKDNIVSYILDKKTKYANLDRYYELVDVVYEIAYPNTISLLSGSVDKTIHLTKDEFNIIPLGGVASNIIPNNYRTINTNLYLFSNSFYSNVIGLEELSLLETLLSKYIKNEVISFDDLDRLIDDISNWNKLEQYNYIPFVLLLLNYFTLNTYDRI